MNEVECETFGFVGVRVVGEVNTAYMFLCPS